MHFDQALNLLWVLLGFLALAGTGTAALRRAPSQRRGSAWLHIVGVALVVVALFPYFSATDDVLRVEHFSQHEHADHPGKKSTNDSLMRLYQAMDTPLVCSTFGVYLTFLFAWFVVIPSLVSIERAVPFRAGRSPPSALALA